MYTTGSNYKYLNDVMMSFPCLGPYDDTNSYGLIGIAISRRFLFAHDFQHRQQHRHRRVTPTVALSTYARVWLGNFLRFLALRPRKCGVTKGVYLPQESLLPYCKVSPHAQRVRVPAAACQRRCANPLAHLTHLAQRAIYTPCTTHNRVTCAAPISPLTTVPVSMTPTASAAVP